VLPKNEAGFSIDDQYYVGASGLLVKPITESGVTETTVYIGEDQVGETHERSHCRYLIPSRFITTTTPDMPTEAHPRGRALPYLHLWSVVLFSFAVAPLFRLVNVHAGPQP